MTDIEKLLDFYHNGPQNHHLYGISQLLPLVISAAGMSKKDSEETEDIFLYAEYCTRNASRHCCYCGDINVTELTAFVRRTLKLLGKLPE